MRTKTLLLTAALCAAGIATSKAQVYSVNAVGYVNTPLVKGYNLIANPLDNKATDGNRIKNLFASLPGGSQIFKFNGTKFDLAEVDLLSGEITGDAANLTVEPGEGVFVFLAPDAPANATITFVGEVKTGALSTPIPTGFSVKSSQVPQAGTASSLSFPAEEQDQIFIYNEATQKYTAYSFSLGAWEVDPPIEVGEAFFVNNVNAAKNWTRTFNINQ
jgi:hypothetical protein